MPQRRRGENLLRSKVCQAAASQAHRRGCFQRAQTQRRPGAALASAMTDAARQVPYTHRVAKMDLAIASARTAVESSAATQDKIATTAITTAPSAASPA